MADLENTARALVAEGKGILAADESDRHDQEAFRLDRRRVHGREPARLPRPAVHDGGRRGVHQRRDPLRRDDPPVGARRHAVPEAARVEGRHPRDQGRRRAPSRSRSPRTRRSPRASTGCARGSRSTASSARASRSGARRTRSTRTGRASTASGRTRTRSRATRRSARRPGIVPIVEPEVLHGRHAHDRAERAGDGPRAAGGLHGAARPARRLPRHAAEAEHGALRLRRVRPRGRRRGRGGDARDPVQARAGRACPASCSSPAARPTRTRPRT